MSEAQVIAATRSKYGTCFSSLARTSYDRAAFDSLRAEYQGSGRWYVFSMYQGAQYGTRAVEAYFNEVTGVWILVVPAGC